MSSEMRSTLLEKKVKQLGFRDGLVVGMGLLLLILGGALGFVGTRGGGSTPAADTKTTQVAAVPVDSLSAAFEQVAKLVAPSVVNISSEQIIHNTGTMEDPFDGMFGGNSPLIFQPAPRSQTEKPRIRFHRRSAGLHFDE